MQKISSLIAKSAQMQGARGANIVPSVTPTVFIPFLFKPCILIPDITVAHLQFCAVYFLDVELDIFYTHNTWNFDMRLLLQHLLDAWFPSFLYKPSIHTL